MDKIGYACINLTLNEQNKISVNRGIIKRTFENKGLNHVSDLSYKNLTDLKTIIEWNEQQKIRNYRMSSAMFPWFDYYKLTDLPNYNEIVKLMQEIGDLAKKYQHKLSFHPNHFNCLASPNQEVVRKSIIDLEQHSLLMDLFGLDTTHFYNINIHVGGVYDDKWETMQRFMNNFKQLSDNLKNRLTLENDDKIKGYTVEDLYLIYREIGIPIVFDTLHWLCNPGNLNYQDSLSISFKTWDNIIPEIHHSSSKRLWEDSKKSLKAHANFIYEKANTLDRSVYVTLESKMKEKALIKYKNDFFK